MGSAVLGLEPGQQRVVAARTDLNADAGHIVLLDVGRNAAGDGL